MERVRMGVGRSLAALAVLVLFLLGLALVMVILVPLIQGQIVQLIAATTTETGLKVRAELDENRYPKGLRVSDDQLAAVNIFPHDFHGEWNYTIAPIRKRSER